jgi:hypothetical protein
VKQTPSITLSEPFPLLDPGQYLALCTEATYAWARQWKKWIARLVLEPQNYQGRPYVGRLCAFLGLGKNPERPYAGPQSRFRQLFVELNGEQPTAASVGIEIFVDRRYEIEVATVTHDRAGQPRPAEHWYSIVREIHPCKSSTNGSRTSQPFNPLPVNPQTQRTREHYQPTNTATPEHTLGKREKAGFQNARGVGRRK